MRTLLAAFSVLSVLPLGKFVPTEKELIRSQNLFPVVGLCFGVLGFAIAVPITRGVPPLPAAMLLALLPEVLTKGFHLDGLADTADGFLSSRIRERKLEIMRDSHIGTMGVTAIFALLGLKFTLLASLPLHVVPAAFGLALLNGRCGILWHILTSRYARPDGLGAIWFRRKPIPGALPALLLPAAAGGFFFGPSGVLFLLISCLAAPIWSLITRAEIGGATGDTIGCFEELCELLTLLGVAVLLPLSAA